MTVDKVFFILVDALDGLSEASRQKTSPARPPVGSLQAAGHGRLYSEGETHSSAILDVGDRWAAGPAQAMGISNGPRSCWTLQQGPTKLLLTLFSCL